MGRVDLRTMFLALGLLAVSPGKAESISIMLLEEAIVARDAYMVTAINRLAEHCNFDVMASDGAEYQDLVFEIENQIQSKPLNEDLFRRYLGREAMNLDRLLAEKDCVSLREIYDLRRMDLGHYLRIERNMQEKIQEFLAVTD